MLAFKVMLLKLYQIEFHFSFGRYLMFVGTLEMTILEVVLFSIQLLCHSKLLFDSVLALWCNVVYLDLFVVIPYYEFLC